METKATVSKSQEPETLLDNQESSLVIDKKDDPLEKEAKLTERKVHAVSLRIIIPICATLVFLAVLWTLAQGGIHYR